jgi:hypothetical protein
MAEAPLEFVIFYEKNYKANEIFIFYLQWTGNEEELTNLQKFTTKALYDDMYGDYSSVYIDLSTKIPESAVDIHCKLRDMNGHHRLFTKCTGKFRCPFDEEDEKRDEYEMATLMDETFYSCHIKDYFYKPKN